MSGPRLSMQEKREIVAMYHGGQSKEAAEKFKVDPSYPRILARREAQRKRHYSPRQKRIDALALTPRTPPSDPSFVDPPFGIGPDPT